jgi:hypothetical protein
MDTLARCGWAGSGHLDFPELLYVGRAVLVHVQLKHLPLHRLSLLRLWNLLEEDLNICAVNILRAKEILVRMVEKREAPAICDDVILKGNFSPSRVLVRMVEKREASA